MEMIKLTAFGLDKINQGKADLSLRFDPSFRAALTGFETGRGQGAEAVAPGRDRTADRVRGRPAVKWKVAFSWPLSHGSGGRSRRDAQPTPALSAAPQGCRQRWAGSPWARHTGVWAVSAAVLSLCLMQEWRFMVSRVQGCQNVVLLLSIFHLAPPGDEGINVVTSRSVLSNQDCIKILESGVWAGAWELVPQQEAAPGTVWLTLELWPSSVSGPQSLSPPVPSARHVCEVTLSLFLLCPALPGVLVFFPRPLSDPFKAMGSLRMPFNECRQTLERLPSQALSPWSCRAVVPGAEESRGVCLGWISWVCGGALVLSGASHAPPPCPGPGVGAQTGRTAVNRAFPSGSPAPTRSFPSQNVNSRSPSFDWWCSGMSRPWEGGARLTGLNPGARPASSSLFQPLAF